MELEWVDGSVDLRCPVCAHSTGQELLATIDVTWRDEGVEIARCAQCGAIVLGAMLPPSMYTDADWDYYIEQIAGVETIADASSSSGKASVSIRRLPRPEGRRSWGSTSDRGCSMTPSIPTSAST